MEAISKFSISLSKSYIVKTMHTSPYQNYVENVHTHYKSWMKSHMLLWYYDKISISNMTLKAQKTLHVVGVT